MFLIKMDGILSFKARLQLTFFFSYSMNFQIIYKINQLFYKT